MPELCHAGRRAFFSGKWKTPCEEIATHLVYASGTTKTVLLCDSHFDEVEAELSTLEETSREEMKRRQFAGPS